LQIINFAAESTPCFVNPFSFSSGRAGNYQLTRSEPMPEQLCPARENSPVARADNSHQRFRAVALRRALPDHGEVERYWGLHLALAMAQQTVRDSERLTKLSEGKCDLDDVEGVIARVVHVAVMALSDATGNKAVPRAALAASLRGAN
jgi:hypothetical protein